MGYLIAGAAGITAVVVVGWLALPARHPPPPPPLPSPAEVREEKAYGKGDRLFIHREPAPQPSYVRVEPPPLTVVAEPPPLPHVVRERRDICARTGGVRVEYNRGRSWRCEYHRRKR